MNNRNKLILFDLDGTIINEDYELTDDTFPLAVKEVQSNGWDIGLNSDTPYVGLQIWKERLGMNGPIVAERGAVVESNGDLDFDRQFAAEVELSKRAIASYLEKNQNVVLWLGNATEAIRDRIPLGKTGDIVVLVNDLSIASLRYFVRRSCRNGELVRDDTAFQELDEELRGFYPDISEPCIDRNPAFGLLIYSQASDSKRQGVQKVMASNSYQRCVMVGNSMSDYIGDDLATHLAVGNADSAFKNRAQTVNGAFTEGCIASLEYVMKNDK